MSCPLYYCFRKKHRYVLFWFSVSYYLFKSLTPSDVYTCWLIDHHWIRWRLVAARHQTIRTNADFFLSTGLSPLYVGEILIDLKTFSLKKNNSRMLSAKCRPFSVNALRILQRWSFGPAIIERWHVLTISDRTENVMIIEVQNRFEKDNFWLKKTLFCCDFVFSISQLIDWVMCLWFLQKNHSCNQ